MRYSDNWLNSALTPSSGRFGALVELTTTTSLPSQTDFALQTPRFGHGIHPTQAPHITRQDPNALDPNISNLEILRDEEIPNPPPPYTPSIPMRASTLAPTTTREASPTPYNTSRNAAAAISIVIVIVIVIGLLIGFLIIRQIAGKNNVNCGLNSSDGEGKRSTLSDTRGRVARVIDRLSWRMEDGAFVRSSMARRADFDDIRSTVMGSKTSGDEDRAPTITAKNPESPTFLSDVLPWRVPAQRESYIPSFHDVGQDDQQPRPPIQPGAGGAFLLLPQRGSPLDTIFEEDFDVFIGDVPPNATDVDEAVHRQSKGSVFRDSFPGYASSSSDSNSGLVDQASKGTSIFKGRGRQDSNASRTTHTSESVAKDISNFSDSFRSNASSATSVATMAYSTVSEISDGHSTEAGEVLETRRVTSMEVKRVVLLDQTSNYAPQLPEVAVSSSILESNFNLESKETQMLQPVMVNRRASSLRTLQSSVSGGTIDLDAFPIPPGALGKPSPIIFTISSASGSIRSLHH